METEPVDYIQIYMRGDLLQELAQVVVQAMKSHNLPSASWRTRKTGGTIQSESKAQSQRATGITWSPTGLRTRSSDVPAKEERICPTFTFFSFTWALNGLNDVNLHW